MYTRQEDIEELEEKFGTPAVAEMCCELNAHEYDVVDGSMCNGRAHDVTMFIHSSDDPSRIAVIRKHFFPPDAFRAPSGAANPGESLERGAVREGLEETGLEIELTRYLARIKATFTFEGRTILWTTHVFDAIAAPGEIDPIDTGEIEEARWATLEELQGPIRQALLDTGWALFRYRVALTDLSVRVMGEVR